MVNLNNLRRWTQELRTTTHPQVSGYLGKVVEIREGGTPVIGNCCLGIGTELAGVTIDFPDDYDDDLDEEVSGVHEGAIGNYDYAQEFPPSAFYEWLEVESTSSGDLCIDWPYTETWSAVYRDRADGPMNWTASSLNDGLGLTFSQIADVVDYFGVRDSG